MSKKELSEEEKIDNEILELLMKKGMPRIRSLYRLRLP